MNVLHPLPEQKEPVRHGEAVFPVQRYETHLGGALREVPAHWHDEAELTLIESGACTCRIQLMPCPLRAGDLVFLPPQLLHDFTAPAPALRSSSFVFHLHFLGSGDVCAMRYLTPLAARTLRPPYVLSPQHPAYPAARACFSRLCTAWETQPPGYELTVKAELLAFLAVLLPHCAADTARQDSAVETLKTALEFLETHCAEDVAIADVAAACYCSESHFMRFFRAHMGVSCGEYLKNLRLKKAAAALRSGEGSILDAALSAGFRSLSYFYRAFREKYGVTPRQYALRSGSN